MLSKEQLDQHLFALVGSDQLVLQWWTTPNRQWQGREPQEIWARNPDEVVTYVMKFCYGDYS